MTYYSHTEQELERLGIQEGDLAIYTGTMNPRRTNTLSPNADRKNAYVYIRQDGQSQELDACFHRDGAGLDVLEVRTGGENYTFLRDQPSGYIRQVSGPERPITVANLGAIPLRVDTFLGKFTVHAGSALRLDESAPRREKKKVLLVVASDYIHPLKSAAMWDGVSWRRLNIREELADVYESKRVDVLDGSAIVQHLEANVQMEIFLMDSPEPDPDYEIYVTTQGWDEATLCFNQSDYRDGRVVQRKRTIAYGIVSAPGVYDLQKLKETQTQSAACQCIIELPKALDGFKPPLARQEETSFLDDRTVEFAPEKRRPMVSDKLRKFLESEDEADEQPLVSEKALTPESPEIFPE